ncbi:MAG: glyoxalase [Mycobacteriaceae bacterium]|nr:glyoxalase [Mycobacteriaceae bacterium]
MTDTAVPMLWTGEPGRTADFYRALGFELWSEQTRPYVYLAFRRRGADVHFTGRPAGIPAEAGVTCQILVDDVASDHAAFAAGFREHVGKAPNKGLPRITRFRPGQTRFTVVDPDGNTVLVIQRDEPEELDYGGSKALTGLAKVIDNARILRDYKNDDKLAVRALEVGLGRYGGEAPPPDKAKAYAYLVDLTTALELPVQAAKWRAELQALGYTESDFPEA